MKRKQYFDANRALWNTRVPLHVKSDFYDVAAFKTGKSALCGIEPKEMGPIQGKSLLHLQCHFGLDSLSLARLGAEVTGVDFSETAIDSARSLAHEVDVPARFVCCNVLDLPQHLEGRFDVVYTSFGVLGWLPDLHLWAQVVHHFLKPDGFLYLLEFHPQLLQLDQLGQNRVLDYFSSGKPEEDVLSSTYADGVPHEPLKEYWWNHSLGEVVTAVLDSGLDLAFLHEFPDSAYRLSSSMVETSTGRWVHPHLKNKMPYMFSLKADRDPQT